QAEVGDLDQIFDRFTPPREPAREMTGEREEALDELLSNGKIGKLPEQLDGSVRVVRRPIVLAHGVFMGDRVRNRIAGLPSSLDRNCGFRVSPWITVHDQLSRSAARGHPAAGASVPIVISRESSLVVISSWSASASGDDSSRRIPASSTAIRTSSTASNGSWRRAAALAATTRRMWRVSGCAATLTVIGVERSSTGSTYTRPTVTRDLRADHERGSSGRARDRGTHAGDVVGPRGFGRARSGDRSGAPRARWRDGTG